HPLTQASGATGSFMESDAARFWVFVAASLVVFFALLRFVTRRRPVQPSVAVVSVVAAVVVVGGMVVAKYGSNIGLPWWVYYTVPALATLLVPPAAFRLRGSELSQYLVLAFPNRTLPHS
ncbi:MAG TPA: hypothetical protein VFS82_04210, partial [Lysobacter sp.]|nr:hypothetical protein [Lysobacter sp.]